MAKKTRLLIPLDGSSNGDAILQAIDPILRSEKAESTLFHVAESADSIGAFEARLEMRRQALERKGVPSRARVAFGRPADEILRESELGACDLVAMTTHGRTGMDRVLLGSVAEEVVHSSKVPTLLCKSGSRVGGWERIVVALNGTAGAEEILEDAVRFARETKAALHLVQVGLSLLWGDAYRGMGWSYEPQDSCGYLDQVTARLLSKGIDVFPHWRTGMAAHEIATFARELDAGLICMTTEGRPEELPWQDRSVAAHVIREAPCPIYVRRMSGAEGIRNMERQASASS